MSGAIPRDVPFSLSCTECDCDSPDTYEDAVSDGWTEITYHPEGLSENFLGLCPRCRQEQEREAAALREPALQPVKTRYTVHVYATVRVAFRNLEAASHEAAARMADELFDWDEHQFRAEYAEEITEYLVDLEGDLGYANSRRLNAEFEEVPI